MSSITDHNVLGTFDDLRGAREAVLALERAGVDGREVSLLAPDHDEESGSEDEVSGSEAASRDLEVTDDLAVSAGVGSAAGAVLGGLAGAAAFAIPGVGPVVGAGIWAAVGGAAIGGSAAGGIAGAIRAAGLSGAWEGSYSSALEDGKAVVAVHAPDQEGATRAASVLTEAGADDVRHLDREGNPRRSS